MMETILLNKYTSVRSAQLEGQDYLVADLTMIVHGVLNGSKGPLYYPLEEIGKEPQIWNHLPIVVYHPTLNGKPISARFPQVLDKYKIGYVLNSHFKDDRLKAEGWFNVERTKKIDSRIYNALLENKPIELSTGLDVDLVPAQANSVFNNIPYTFITRNYRPDHLAVLPDQQGACSVRDGCGVNVSNNLQPEQFAYIGDKDKPDTWKLRIDTIDHCINSLDLLARNKVIIPFDKRDEIKRKIKKGWLKAFAEDTTLNQSQINNLYFLYSKGLSMALTTNDRESIVNYITTNCDCWKEDGDKEVLNSFSDDKLTKLRKAVENSHKPKEEPKEKTQDTLVTNTNNTDRNSVVTQPVTTPAPTTPVQNKPQTVEEWLNSAPDQIKSLVKNAASIVDKQKVEVINKLIAHLPEDRKQTTTQLLNNKTLEDLELMVALQPAPTQTKSSQVTTPNYTGNVPTPPVTNKVDDPDDILPLPVLNWAKDN